MVRGDGLFAFRAQMGKVRELVDRRDSCTPQGVTTYSYWALPDFTRDERDPVGAGDVPQILLGAADFRRGIGSPSCSSPIRRLSNMVTHEQSPRLGRRPRCVAARRPG